MIRRPGPARRPSASEASAKSMWLISFTDLISLLLGFFVMLYGMAEPERAKWAEVARGVSARSTAQAYSERAPSPTAAFNGAVIETKSRLNLDYLSALLRAQMKESPELSRVVARREDDRVVLELPGDALFVGDTRVVSEAGRRALYLLGTAAALSGHRIEVVGFAENAANGSGPAWEAALTRAVVTAAALRETGYGTVLTARAASPTKAGAAGRVDIVIRDQEG